MKNFRKVLALVLVVATLFSFVAMASAKSLADYKDAEAVSYDEAVAVLSAIGILNGYEDDTFKPKAKIDRDEMAKMIAVMANAGYEVDELYASACKFADTKDTWAASYVAYCAAAGIVDGRTETTFDPDAKVTGVETAKMLLVLLGFDGSKQGYTGADWQVNVLRDAKVMGLLNNFAANYDITAEITREEAAQMMLNALEAPAVVGYLSENVIDVTNALIFEQKTMAKPGKLTRVASYATLKDAIAAGNWCLYDNVVISDDVLGWTLFGLVKTTKGSADCYGRPCVTWTYKNAKGTVCTIGTYGNETMVGSWSETVDLAGKLEEELKVGTYALNAYVDGAAVLTWKDYNTAKDEADLDKFVADNLGNGVLVELYVNDTAKVITIVVINTYLGKVSSVQKASNTFVVDGHCFSNKGYDFAADQVIWYWLCNGACGGDKCASCAYALHNAAAATPAEMTLTRATTEPIAVLNGTSYEYAKSCDYYMAVAEVSAAKDGQTYDVYVDEYGYIKAWDEHTVSVPTYYAYVVENTGSYDDNGRFPGSDYFTYTATKDTVDFDAKYNKDTKVHWSFFNAMDHYEDLVNYQKGVLVSYQLDGETLVPTGISTQVYDGYIEADGDIVDYTNNVLVNGTAATKYLVRTWNYSTDSYEYTAYTEDTLPYGIAGHKLYADGNALIPTIQYFATVAAAGTPVATYVFVDAAYAATSVDAFVVDYVKSVFDGKFVHQIGAYDEYDAYINGEPAKLLVAQNYPLLSVVPGLYTAELQCIGLYDNNIPVYAAVYGNMISNCGTTYVYDATHDELFFDGQAYDYTENFFAVVYNAATGKTVSFTDVASLNAYVESQAGALHADHCDCVAYHTGDSWITWAGDEIGGDIAALYLIVDYAPCTHVHA